MGDYNPVVVRNLERVPNDIVDSFRELSTPNVSDALERNRINGVMEGIRAMVQGAKVVGPAITVRYVPLSPAEQGTREDIGDYLFEIAQPGDVIVIDNGGVTTYTCWGDILTFTAIKLGIAGTVIDGVFRDYLIIGDDTGVLRVPKERAREVLKDAKEVEEAERMIIEAVNSGLTLREARQKYRYFQLQRAKT
jgi:regulator of RNase E activity RraA